MKQYSRAEVHQFAKDAQDKITNYDKAFDRERGFYEGFQLAQRLLNPDFVREEPVRTKEQKKAEKRKMKELFTSSIFKTGIKKLSTVSSFSVPSVKGKLFQQAVSNVHPKYIHPFGTDEDHLTGPSLDSLSYR